VKEPYKRDHILQQRRIILRSLLLVATPYHEAALCIRMSQLAIEGGRKRCVVSKRTVSWVERCSGTKRGVLCVKIDNEIILIKKKSHLMSPGIYKAIHAAGNLRQHEGPSTRNMRM